MILTFLASILPSVLLPAFKEWLAHKSNVETTRRDVALKTIDERMDARKHRAATMQKGMDHWPFWVAWSAFAWPLGLWWAVVLLDTTFSFSFVVPDLPQSIRPWAETVFQNIFLPGAGVAAATIVAKGIARR